MAYMAMEAEIEVSELQAKERQALPANHQKQGRILPLQMLEGSWFC